MSGNARSAVVIFVALMIGMALIPPAFFGIQPKPDSFQVFGDRWLIILYNYQTLIAGIAAVAGALATVWQMRVNEMLSDARHADLVRQSEEQHAELMELNIRPDRLRIERLLVPNFNDLRLIYLALEPFEADPGNCTKEEEIEIAAGIAREMDNLTQLCQATINTLNKHTWTDAEPLFGGNLTAYVATLMRRLAELQTHSNFIIFNWREGRVQWSVGDEIVDLEHYIVIEIPSAVFLVRSSMAKVFEELRALAARYKIEI